MARLVGRAGTRGAHAGFSLVELCIATAMLIVISTMAVSTWSSESHALKEMAGVAEIELRAQETLARLEAQLGSARGRTPTAFLTQDAQPLDALFEVDGRVGFPDRGLLLVGRGTSTEERVGYARVAPGNPGFEELERGAQCTSPALHVAGEEVLWAGIAAPIALQNDPPADQWDGVARELEGPTYFRGDGSGFAFQVPVDPGGGHAFLVDGEARWGATILGSAVADAWSAFAFEPTLTLSESECGCDLDADGDQDDLFDVGKLRLRSWDPAHPDAPAQDVGLGPDVVLQEHCNWGSDLDGDGFDDPIFLWNPSARRLHVRLYCVCRTNGAKALVRRSETTVFLRNASLE